MTHKKIITFTGNSGTGKSSIAQELLKDSQYRMITSYTTRCARDSDLTDEYNYLTIPRFMDYFTSNSFPWNPLNYAGNYYGTTKESLEDALNSKEISMMILLRAAVDKVIDYLGSDCVLPFYIKSPGIEILRERMRNRGDSMDSIDKRMDYSWDKHMNSRYTSIDNGGTIQEAVAHVRRYL
jgi:guanylate kinase